jgi:pimeloyl-ACP methyl ester carboxylesterase
VPIGVSRLLANLSKKKLGEEQRMERIHALRPQTYRAYKGEFNNVQHLPEPFKAGALKDIPLVVLYAEGNITTEAIKDKVPNPEETVRKTRAAIQANNEQLATLSSRSQVVMSPAGHYIQRDDPTLVVEKIKELIEMARSPLA